MKRVIIFTLLSFCLLSSVLCLLSSWGCLKSPTQPTVVPKYNVFAILDPMKRNQKVIVDKIYAMDEDANKKILPLAKEVKLQCPAFEVGFSPIIDTPTVYRDTSVVFYVMPESTYTLSILFNDGIIMTTKTKVPGVFYIFWPMPGDTIDLSDSLDAIIWTASKGAKGYLVSLFTKAEDWVVTFATQDTILPALFISFYSPQIFREEGSYRVDIKAIDENYYNYEEEKINIDKVIGCLGSIFHISRYYYFKIPPIKKSK
ncbi:MAG: hypothetical protein HY769_09710 [Candidatus Stahlbacteria bacterium]|nr:hypothetical protein [Candidatus Stahlbacteria bacterium]